MTNIQKTHGAEPVGAVISDIRSARSRAAVEHPPAPDAAGFSQGARELARARAEVDQSSDVRTERLMALKRQIENGSYRPDPQAIAKKLLDTGF